MGANGSKNLNGLFVVRGTRLGGLSGFGARTMDFDGTLTEYFLVKHHSKHAASVLSCSN